MSFANILFFFIVKSKNIKKLPDHNLNYQMGRDFLWGIVTIFVPSGKKLTDAFNQ